MSIKMKFIPVILLCVIICLSFSGCYAEEFLQDFAPHIDEENFHIVSEPVMRYEFDEEYNSYEVYIEGIVENGNLQEACSSVYITFAIYDDQGNTIGTASGYCEYLEAGARWRYCAEGYLYFEPVSCKMISLFQY